MMLAAPRYLPETTPRGGQADVAGAVASTLGMTGLVFSIVHSADAGWGDAVTLLAVAAGALLLGLFVVNERRATQPIIPLRLFANRERSGAYTARPLFLGAVAMSSPSAVRVESPSVDLSSRRLPPKSSPDPGSAKVSPPSSSRRCSACTITGSAAAD